MSFRNSLQAVLLRMRRSSKRFVTPQGYMSVYIGGSRINIYIYSCLAHLCPRDQDSQALFVQPSTRDPRIIKPSSLAQRNISTASSSVNPSTITIMHMQMPRAIDYEQRLADRNRALARDQAQRQPEQLPSYPEAVKSGSKAPQGLEEKAKAESATEGNKSHSKKETVKAIAKFIIAGPPEANRPRPHARVHNYS